MKDEQAGKAEQAEQHYRDIATLYDMADDLASTVESEFVADPKAQIALMEPLITPIADATDLLVEEYTGMMTSPTRKKTAKGKVEAALRKIFMALEHYRASLGAGAQKTLGALANIADPIVEKIRAQAQKITIIFMQLIDISLERIMQKYEIEEFRRSNAKILPGLQLGH